MSAVNRTALISESAGLDTGLDKRAGLPGRGLILRHGCRRNIISSFINVSQHHLCHHCLLEKGSIPPGSEISKVIQVVNAAPSSISAGRGIREVSTTAHSPFSICWGRSCSLVIDLASADHASIPSEGVSVRGKQDGGGIC
jgi:hypothetical protein